MALKQQEINARKREKYKLNPEAKRLKNRQWYYANKVKKLNKAAEWEKANTEARKVQRQKRKDLIKGTPIYRWRMLKHSAYNRKNTPIEFSKDEFIAWAVLNDICVYCKTPNTKAGSFVDRIDPKQPYRLANIAACCMKCNVAKNKYSLEEFKEHVLKMYHALFG